MSDGPSPVIRAILLSIGATATAYRVFDDFGIAIVLGIALGVLGAVALAADQRRREAERLAVIRERESRRQAQMQNAGE